MAELTTAPATSSCCSPDAQEDCCEPSDKDACCGAGAAAGAAGGRCGCSAGRATEVQDIRETHRVHDQASSAIIRARKPA